MPSLCRLLRSTPFSLLVLCSGLAAVSASHAAPSPSHPLPLVTVQEAEDELGSEVAVILVPEGISENGIRLACASAFTNHGWTLVSRDDGKVIGRLNDDGWSQTLTAIYTAKEVKVYARGTRKGKPGINQRWVNFYTKRLNTYLLRGALH